MPSSGSSTTELALPRLPLALPRDLWSELSDEERAIYRGAQTIIEGLQTLPDYAEFDLSEAEPEDPEMLFGALRLLEEMGLVRVETDGTELGVTLLALPEEHIRIKGPGQSDRWVFISRPLNEPEWAEYDLN